MLFNGFEVSPVGKASLAIENEILKVNGISDSGLDGVLIHSTVDEDYTVTFGPLQSIPENKGVLKIQNLVRNPYGMVLPNFESYKWFDEESNKVIMGYNRSLLSDEFKFFGKIGGEEVFSFNNGDLEPSDPDFPGGEPQAIAWGVIVAAAAVGVAIWQTLRTKTTTTTTRSYDAQGHLTGTTVTTSEDPVPFEVEVNGSTYNVDEVGIISNSVLANGEIGNRSFEYQNVAKQITGYNINSFEITSIFNG